jgi:predicted nuclease of restriction endonuclease-like (RecB) superfamily
VYPQTAKSLISQSASLPPGANHFVEVMKVDDPLKRALYEVESVRGVWSVRELKRQMASLYYERSRALTGQSQAGCDRAG